MEFYQSWHVASTMWVPYAHLVISGSNSKWLPGGEICDFLELIFTACQRRFLRHRLMEFYQSWHIASTIWVPYAHWVISGSNSKWPPGSGICDFLGLMFRACQQRFFQTLLGEFYRSLHIASTICVPYAHQVVTQSDSKWPPGGEICNFFGLICRACQRRFLRHRSVEFYQSWHIASNTWVPYAHRVIFWSNSKWPPGGEFVILGGGWSLEHSSEVFTDIT